MKVSIIGSGITGRATGIGLLKHEHEVIFTDTNPKVLQTLESEGYKVAEVTEAIRASDIHMVCVPTPLKGDTLDLAHLKSAVKTLAQGMVKKNSYQVVVVRSTVLPLTIRTKVLPLLERYGPLKMGKDYDLCHNPEFLREAPSMPKITILRTLSLPN